MREVRFKEVLNAQTNHNNLGVWSTARWPVWKLEVGEKAEGVLLGAGFNGGVLVLLDTPEGTAALNGHADLCQQLAEVPVGEHVSILLLRKGGKGGVRRYVYEVKTTQMGGNDSL